MDVRVYRIVGTITSAEARDYAALELVGLTDSLLELHKATQKSYTLPRLAN